MDMWWRNWSGKIPRYTKHKVKDVTEKNNLSLLFHVTFHQPRTAKKLWCFNFYCFPNCSNLNLEDTGPCFQEWNDLGVRPMLAEIRFRLGTKCYFYFRGNVIAYQKISVFANPFMLFYIHNQDRLLMDIHLLQGIFNCKYWADPCDKQPITSLYDNH